MASGVFFLGWSGLAASKNASVKKYYTDRLTKLDKAANGLITFTDKVPDTNKIKAENDQYNKLLDDMRSNCQQMVSRYPTAKNQTAGKLKDAVDRSNLLCQDLLKTLAYAKGLNDTEQPYLNFARQWPDTKDQSYGLYLDDAIQVTQETKDKINGLDNSFVQDPAVPELTSQLDHTNGLAHHLKSTILSGDFDTANTLSGPFINQLNKDKQNFLNARNYLWQNTIFIHKLHHAVQDVQNSFPA